MGTHAIALITVLLIGSAGADNNVAQPVGTVVAVPAVMEKMDSNLRGIVPVANTAEKIHAPPNWQPPSTFSGLMALASIFLIPLLCLAGMKWAKDKNGGGATTCLIIIPILILFVYTSIAALQ